MEPESLRRGKEFHKKVQSDWDVNIKDGNLNIEHTINLLSHPSRVKINFHTKLKRLMPISIIIATIFLTAIGIACIELPPSGIIICAFDQNPAGLDEGNEWVTLHNPTNKSVDIGNWTLETTNGSTASVWIAEGTTLYPGAYITISPSYRWIDNNNESLILRDAVGDVVDRTPIVNVTRAITDIGCVITQGGLLALAT